MSKLLFRYQINLLPALTVLLSFSVVCIFLFPLYNSGDDFMFMYFLSGNWNGVPTNILHLDYCWHPVAGWIVKTLFAWMPGPNWYSIFLICLLYTGHFVIARFLVKGLGTKPGLLCWFIIFLFSGLQSVLNLNYTSAAWTISVAGYLLLLEIFKFPGRKKAVSIGSWSLLILGGLLRIHALAVVSIFFLVIFLQNYPSRWRLWGSKFLILVLVMVGFGLIQKANYRAQIPDWEERQEIRMSLIRTYNHPVDRTLPWNKVFRDSTEALSFLNHFYYRSPFIQKQRLEAIGDRMIRARNLSNAEDRQAAYWLFIGLRVYILLFAIVLLLLWLAGSLKIVLGRSALSLALVAAFIVYLFFFLKFTIAVYSGLFSLALLGIFSGMDRHTFQQLSTKRIGLLTWMVLLPVGWMTLRIFKENKKNREDQAVLATVAQQIKQHPEYLFVIMDNSLPVDNYYIWDKPADYKFTNLVFKGRGQLAQDSISYQNTKLSTTNEKLFLLPNARMVGENMKNLSAFLRICYGRNISFENADEHFRFIHVWKAKKDTLKH